MMQKVQTSMTSTEMTIVINGFCNCDGCIQKVKKTLGELGDVKLLAMNPEIGKFTILTAKHPEVIKFSLERTTDVHDIAKTLMTILHAKGLESVEYNQWSSLKINFTNHGIQPSTSRSSSTKIQNVAGYNDFEYAPPLPPNPVKPSAPFNNPYN
ncbi:unnamed protein product [Lactuca virosa]|uniref:HMA domain-containing protein n=1 Tax=Lactuca virosa TaxID=75947 RepID=A0AAU9NLQ6_9ASTR|nr:unnamed protein product [Lactuca virosa]